MKLEQAAETGTATRRFLRMVAIVFTKSSWGVLLDTVPKTSLVLSERVAAVGSRTGWTFDLDVMKKIPAKSCW